MTIPPPGGSRDPRILVLAPTGKDATLARSILATHGFGAVVCPTFEELSRALADGAGLVLVAEEALTPDVVAGLHHALGEQPPWSDLPVLVVVRGPISSRSLEQLESLGNVTLLERPLRIPALLSAVRAALRARTRQYQMRDLMVDLREANHAKDDFLAAVSHELRTPLNAIGGWAMLLQRLTDDPERMRQGADVIDRNSRVLTRLVEDLIDKARIAKGQFRLNLGDVDLVRVVSAAVEAVAPAAAAKSCSELPLSGRIVAAELRGKSRRCAKAGKPPVPLQPPRHAKVLAGLTREVADLVQPCR